MPEVKENQTATQQVPAPAAPETGEQEADAPETDSQAPNEGLAESPQTPDAGETIELP